MARKQGEEESEGGEKLKAEERQRRGRGEAEERHKRVSYGRHI